MSEASTDPATPVVVDPPTDVPSAAPTEKVQPADTDWKAEARKWETRAKENAAKLKAAEPRLVEYDQLIEAKKSDLEKAQEAAQTASERVNSYQTRAVKAEVKALATATFADPDDAAAFLDIASYAASDGDIDTAKIAADLTALLERKPHLGKGESRRIPNPNPAQGANAFGGSPTLDDQIAAAVKDGDVKKQIYLQTQKLTAPQR